MKAETIIEGIKTIRTIASSKGWDEVHNSVLPKIASEIEAYTKEQGIEKFLDEILPPLGNELTFITIEEGEEIAIKVASELTTLKEEDIIKLIELKGQKFVSEYVLIDEETSNKLKLKGLINDTNH